MDNDPHPGLKEGIVDYEVLKEPHKIITAGEHVIEGIAKGTISGIFFDKSGNTQPVSFSAI